MKIQASEIRTQNRTALETVIPLDTPYNVFIDPSNACNLACKFCPTGDKPLLKRVGRKAVMMTDKVFYRVLSGLASFPRRVKRVNLYKDGEPLYHPKFVGMVRALKWVADEVWTKTNGTLLNKGNNEKIAESGLDMLGVSIKAVSTQGYKDVSGVPIHYENILRNLEHLYNIRGDMKIYASIADTGLSEEERQEFYEDFAPITDYCSIEGLHGWSMSGVKDFTLGTNPTTFDGIPLVDKAVCPWVFYQMAVNSDGSVSACNEDWSHGVIIGDVMTETLPDIWNGSKLYDLRRMFLTGKRGSHPVCGDCYYLRCAPDNIDQHAETILTNLDERRNGA